jgi:hypothetical protein
MRHRPLHDRFSTRPVIGFPQTMQVRTCVTDAGEPQEAPEAPGEGDVAGVASGRARNRSMAHVPSATTTIKTADPGTPK